MTTQNYLAQIDRCDAVIENQIISIKQMDEMLCSIGGKPLNPDKIQLTTRTDKMQEKIAKLIDAEDELADLVDKYVDIRKVITSQIAKVPNATYYRILMGRYVHNKSFKQIAVENDYSIKQLRRLHIRALNCFEQMFGKEYKDYNLEIEKDVS